MTNLTPELEAMVEPLARKLNEADNIVRPNFAAEWDNLADTSQESFRAEARLAISLGARIKVPKSPGQRAFETAYDLGWWIGTWEEMGFKSRAGWERIAAAAREES